MPPKFEGSFDGLKDLIRRAGVIGEWADEEDKRIFRSKQGGVLSWWPNGTVLVQGKREAKEAIEQAIGLVAAMPAQKPFEQSAPLRQIFIVHGHDAEARDQLELALLRLGLEPFVLMNTSGEGKTLIEALEGRIGRDYSADFGIVLMTPDDVGYSSKDGPERAEPRARQNVVLETGMLLSSLTRDRMAIVVKGHLELPSDLEGIIRFGYNVHVKEIVPKLCQRLKEVGFDLTPAQIAAAAQ